MTNTASEDHAIAVLLDAAPELAALYGDVAEVDEDASPELVFAALAEEAGALLRSGVDEERLEAIFAAVEHVTSYPYAERAALTQSVAFGFLDALPPELRLRASAYAGPATELLMARLDDGELDADAELWSLEPEEGE
ncbi:MAG TPA: hypothetical protein VMD59_04070 [Acidimicrobiales bacterium]|nr:hypothetical protein [Acidimicrobiales bacterium]